jgi:hypothetical protein
MRTLNLEMAMASDAGSSGGSNAFLAFIVGGLLVVVAIFGFFMFTGGHLSLQNSQPSVNLTVKPPTIPNPAPATKPGG